MSKYLAIHKIEPGVFQGSPASKVIFAGDGLLGDLLSVKQVVEQIKEIDTPHVVLTGSDPMKQNMLLLVGLCYLLKRRLRKKTVLETKGTRFNQLLFLNVKHFILHPDNYDFRPEKFERYMKYSSYKSLELGKNVSLAPVDKSTGKKWNYARFVEVSFDIGRPGDMKFASTLFNDYGVRHKLLRTHIKRLPSYSPGEFARDWKEYYDTFLPYNWLYMYE